MSVDGELVVDNWGLHGKKEVKKTIALNKGYKDIKVEFFQNGGGALLEVKYKGPDTGGNQKYLEGWYDPNRA